MPSLLKTDFLFLKAKSAEKSQIHNIKCRFYNFNNSNNLNNLCEPFGVSEQLTARKVNHRKLGDSWGAVGRKLGNRTCGHLGQLVYMHVKILKPEVKRPDTKLHAQKFRNQRYYLRKRIHAKILKPEVHKNSQTRPDKNLETTPVKNLETRGGKFFKKFHLPY